MKTKGKSVSKQLAKEATFIKNWAKSDWGKEIVENRAANLIVGCFYILSQNPGTDLRGWLKRKPRRVKLKNYVHAIRSDDGRKAVLELIALTQSAVETRSPSKEWNAGPLECSSPKRSEAQVQASTERLKQINSGRNAA